MNFYVSFEFCLHILLNFINSRTVFLYVLFFIMSCVLFNRIFQLQIVEGADKQAEFEALLPAYLETARKAIAAALMRSPATTSPRRAMRAVSGMGLGTAWAPPWAWSGRCW